MRPTGPPTAVHDVEPLLARGVALLRSLGLGEGDRVAVVLPNDARTFGILAAACLEGIVAVPLPPDATVGELTEILADAAPAVVLSTPDRRAALRERHPRVEAIDGPRFDALRPLEPTSSWPRTRPMAYTSGTTGRRKGVDAGVHTSDWGRAMVDDEHAAFDRRHGELHLVVSPLYHSGPFRFALVTALLGGRIAVLPRFDATAWAATLRTLRPSSVFCVPTQLRRLVAARSEPRESLASLTLLAHAGAPCPIALKEQLLALAPTGTVWEFYGATEGQFTTCPPDVWSSAPGTVGRARPGRTLEVRDADGRSLPPGEVGAVWARVPDHARFTYWRDPLRTAQAWNDDAFTVGDLGHLDADGRLFLRGRPGDLVITGGVNVYPMEVERHLLELPGVAEAAVFGVDDAEWGQRLVAVVVPWPGAEVDGATLRQALRGRLSPAKVPKDIRVVAELPRTPTGKIRRAGGTLAALLEQEP